MLYTHCEICYYLKILLSVLECRAFFTRILKIQLSNIVGIQKRKWIIIKITEKWFIFVS